MRTVAIITARWNSKRLPGKALVDICGKPLLQYIVDSAKEAQYIDDVVVATTELSQPIIDYCKQNMIKYYPSVKEDDILSRLFMTALWFNADIIVRLWGDAPLITPSQIDAAIKFYNSSLYKYQYSTCSSKLGTIAVVSFDRIKDVHINIQSVENRHWIHRFLSEQKQLTVDTPEDLELVRDIVRSQGNN